MNLESAKAIVEAGKKLGFTDDILTIDENFVDGAFTVVAVKGMKYFINKALVYAAYLEGKGSKEDKECSFLDGGIMWYWVDLNKVDGIVAFY